MQPRTFLRAGHAPTLACAFLYFDISFMVWVILGALANSIVPQFDLQPVQKGLMVSVPLLSGAVLRLPMGLLTDRIGARRTGLLGLGLTLLPLLLGWLWADSFGKLLVVGLLLGSSGASFAVPAWAESVNPAARPAAARVASQTPSFLLLTLLSIRTPLIMSRLGAVESRQLPLLLSWCYTPTWKIVRLASTLGAGA